MSALGQKQTFAPQKVMSALPPKAGVKDATSTALPDFVTHEDVAQMMECAMEIAGEESGKLVLRISALENEIKTLRGMVESKNVKADARQR